MDMRESLVTKQAKEDSDGLKMVKSAIKVFLLKNNNLLHMCALILSAKISLDICNNAYII